MVNYKGKLLLCKSCGSMHLNIDKIKENFVFCEECGNPYIENILDETYLELEFPNSAIDFIINMCESKKISKEHINKFLATSKLLDNRPEKRVYIKGLGILFNDDFDRICGLLEVFEKTGVELPSNINDCIGNPAIAILKTYSQDKYKVNIRTLKTDAELTEIYFDFSTLEKINY